MSTDLETSSNLEDVPPAGKKTKTKVKNNVATARSAAKADKVVTYYKIKDKRIRKAKACLKSVADETRMAVLLTLASTDMNVSALCASLGTISQPALSHHLSLMRGSELVEGNRDAKTIVYSITAKGKKMAKAIKSLLEDDE